MAPVDPSLKFEPLAQPDYGGPLLGLYNYDEWKEYLNCFLTEGERRYPRAFHQAKKPTSTNKFDSATASILASLASYLSDRDMQLYLGGTGVLMEDIASANAIVKNIRKEISKMPAGIKRSLRSCRWNDADPISGLHSSLDILEGAIQRQRWLEAAKGRPSTRKQVELVSNVKRNLELNFEIKFPKTFIRADVKTGDGEEFVSEKLELLFFIVRALDPRIKRSQVEAAVREVKKMEK